MKSKAMKQQMENLMAAAEDYLRTLVSKPSQHVVPWRAYARPGAPPTLLSGRLQAGAYHRVMTPPGARIVGIVGVREIASKTSGVSYPKLQEQGTTRMPAHPFLKQTHRWMEEHSADYFEPSAWSARDVQELAPWGRQQWKTRKSLLKVRV